MKTSLNENKQDWLLFPDDILTQVDCFFVNVWIGYISFFLSLECDSHLTSMRSNFICLIAVAYNTVKPHPSFANLIVRAFILAAILQSTSYTE